LTDVATASRPVVRDLTGSWPMVGRTEVLARIVEGLTASTTRAFVVGGSAGVGKSRLLSEATATAQRRDMVVARVTATRSASSIPFGAVAPLLPVDDLLADSLVGVLQRAARAIANLGNGRDVLLSVDDAHLLDEASATLIHQLAIDGSVRLLLAIRTGEQISAALAGVVNDPSTDTIELHQLRRRDVEALTATVLGDAIDGAVLQSLWDGSQGNPLYLRELLAAATEEGSLENDEGVWRLTRKPTVPSRLVELIDARLESLGDDERVALEILAVAHSVGRTALEDLVGTDTVSHLVQRGLIVAGRDERRQPVRLQHPLYEEAVRRRMSSRRTRNRQLELADLIDARGMRRRDDRLAVTTLRLDAGGKLDLDLLETAAMDAYFALDADLTERLTRAGVAAGAGPKLRRLLAEIMRWQGRHDEAEAIVSGISLTDVDERERALTVLVRAENMFRGLGERERATRLLHDVRPSIRDAAWRDELTAMEAVFDALAGDVRTAHAAATPIIERGPSRAMAVAATASVAALTFMGRPDEATAVAEAAFAAASALAPQESQAVVATHVMERVLGLVESGRLAEAEMIGRMSYEWSLASGHAIGQGWFSLLLARSAQTGGRLEESARRYRESSLVFRDLRDHGIRRWALAGLAQVTATLGREAEASMVLDELDTAPKTAVHLLEAEVMRARAWVAVARNTPSEARRLLADAADWAASRGQHGLELTMCHDLVRIGDSRVAAARAAALAPTLEGRLNAARGLHAAAARAQDGAALDHAAAELEAIGANLYAAEAAAQAAVAHRRNGRASLASASEARSADLAARCDGAVTPGLDATTDHEAARLTARELELARLAADGQSSAEIATQLGISIRTVNNLLQRAYTKLGISGRRDLANRLENL
jgi:DNA-binding CsgD family transcriptional regulator